MNYFLNEEMLTHKEDSGKNFHVKRVMVRTEEMQARNGKCFCKKRSNGESRNSTQIKVWKENANSKFRGTRCQNDRSTERIQ